MKSSVLQVDGTPRYPFVNHPFIVTLQLLRGGRLVCGENYEISLKLYVNKDDKPLRVTDPILVYYLIIYLLIFAVLINVCRNMTLTNSSLAAKVLCPYLSHFWSRPHRMITANFFYHFRL